VAQLARKKKEIVGNSRLDHWSSGRTLPKMEHEAEDTEKGVEADLADGKKKTGPT